MRAGKQRCEHEDRREEATLQELDLREGRTARTLLLTKGAFCSLLPPSGHFSELASGRV